MLPFIGTSLGAAMVFLLKDQIASWLQKLLLGFASGVMMAASVWSLLLPAMDMAAESGGVVWLPAVVGFLAGMFSLLLFDTLVPHLHLDSQEPEGVKSGLGRSTMLFLSVTLHNIPEGMAVGVVLAGALNGSAGMTVAGALALSLLNIEGAFERFGEWLKVKTGNARDKGFVNAFVTASLTVCIGAMAIVGSIQDGILGDYSILAAKAVLDLIIIMVMTCSLGRGAVFSAIPVAVFQGSITLLAGLVKPIMTAAALANLSLVGNVLIFCVGINLVWGKKIRVANLLPAVVVAVIAAFLPI